MAQLKDSIVTGDLRVTGKIYGTATNSDKVNNLTVLTAVPANAKFTDTTYTSKTAASGGTEVSLVTTGEKYTWNNKSNLAIGTTASTAAAGNHTHSTSIATSTGTNQLSLSANTKYAITAGGTSFIFTTPKDENTTYSSKTAASGGTDVSLVTTGEKYTWNNKSNLAIGTTASTAAAGNHTHTLSIAKSTGTNAITLEASTKYQLTAGGSTYIFTTPPNTTYSSKTAASGGTDVSLVTTGEKYTWNSKTSNTGTVTSITVKTTSPISGGSDTAVTGAGTWTISHANSGVTAGTYGSATAVPKITVDATGHVTGVTNTTITASAATKYTTCTLPVFKAAGSKAVTVSGVTANSNPVLDVYIDTAANLPTYVEAWSHIYRADTSANKITFYSDAATSTALTVMVKDY